MPTSQSQSAAWKNQFRRPSVDELLDALNPDDRKHFDSARAFLTASDDLTESLAWHGIPWRWSLAFSHPNESPRLFLVPEPGRPALAMSITAREVDAIGLRSLPRSAREGIVNATYVAGVLWAEWPLTSQTLVDDLSKLLRKLNEAAAAPA